MALQSESFAADKSCMKAPDRSLLGSRIPLASLMQALAVAEHLNFRHAAASLGVSQSRVSQRIKQLEDDLGILLFERRHRGVAITAVGRHFLNHIAAAVGYLEQAVRTAGMMALGEQGSLRVGLSTSIGAGFLAVLLAEFRQSHTDIECELSESQVQDMITQLRQDRLDVAFVIGVPNVEDCHSRQLWTERLMVALPKDHTLAKTDGVTFGVTWRELISETFLVRYDGDGPQMQDHIIRRLAQWGRRPNIQRRNVQRDNLMRMVADGDGITLAFEAAARVPIHGITFKPILDEPEPIIFSAVWSPFNRSPLLRDLLDLAQLRSRKASPEN